MLIQPSHSYQTPALLPSPVSPLASQQFPPHTQRCVTCLLKDHWPNKVPTPTKIEVRSLYANSKLPSLYLTSNQR